MLKEFITTSSDQTQKLGETLAEDLHDGGVVCMTGDLGAGKTTFTQGLLRGLGATGPYTSPTFVIMKEYEREISNFKFQISNEPQNSNSKIQKAYHIDAYRVGAEDILALGWEEMIANSENIIIIEWAERVKDIIPAHALWIDFEWLGEEERRITFKSKG